MPDISALNRSVYLDSAAKDFFEVARAKAYGKSSGDVGGALRFAQSRGTATPRLQQMLKAAVPAGSLSGWAGELALIEPSSQAFLALLPPYSSFDRLLADHAVTPMPLHSRLATATSTLIASTVGEGFSKPMSQFTVNSEVMPETKAVAQVTYSKELLITRTSQVDALFEQMLRNAMAQETDRTFLNILTQGTGIASRPSSGLLAANFIHDLELAQGGIETGVGSRLYFIMPRPLYLTAKLLRDSGGFIVSPDDMVGAIKLIPTSAKIAGTTNPITYSVMVDATCIGADGGVVIPESSEQASIQLDTAPGTPPTGVVSLWQQGLVTSRIERRYGACVLRAEGIAVVTSVDLTA